MRFGRPLAPPKYLSPAGAGEMAQVSVLVLEPIRHSVVPLAYVGFCEDFFAVDVYFHVVGDIAWYVQPGGFDHNLDTCGLAPFEGPDSEDHQEVRVQISAAVRGWSGEQYFGYEGTSEPLNEPKMLILLNGFEMELT